MNILDLGILSKKEELDYASIIAEEFWFLEDAVCYINDIVVYCEEEGVDRFRYKTNMTSSRTYLKAVKAIKDNELENLGFNSDDYTVKPSEFLFWAKMSNIRICQGLNKYLNYQYWTEKKFWNFSEVVYIFNEISPPFPHEINSPFEATEDYIYTEAAALEEVVKSRIDADIDVLKLNLEPEKWLELIELSSAKSFFAPVVIKKVRILMEKKLSNKLNEPELPKLEDIEPPKQIRENKLHKIIDNIFYKKFINKEVVNISTFFSQLEKEVSNNLHKDVIKEIRKNNIEYYKSNGETKTITRKVIQNRLSSHETRAKEILKYLSHYTLNNPE